MLSGPRRGFDGYGTRELWTTVVEPALVGRFRLVPETVLS